jgi:hypothetical protein
MDLYSLAKQRHADEIQRAEERAQLAGWPARQYVADRVAMRLRRLADRIDGRRAARFETHQGA